MKVIKKALDWLEARALPALLVVLVLALGLRLAVLVLFVAPDPSRLTYNVDAKGYERLAVNLLNGNGFTASEAPPFTPEVLRTPGYPLFVAGIYSLAGISPISVAFVQILLDVVSVALLYVVASMTGSKALAIVASCTRAFDPAAVALSNSLMSETVFIFFVLLSLLVIQRLLVLKDFGLVSAVWLGVVTAVCALVRPVGLYYGLGIGGFLLLFFWRKMRRPRLIKFLSLYLLTFAVLLSPWIVRNYAVMGAFFFSTASSYNLLFENAVYVEAAEAAVDPAKVSAVKRLMFSTLSQGNGWNQYETSLAMRDTALSILLHHWQTTATLFLRGVGVRLIAPHRQEYGILLHGEWRVSGSPGVLYTSGFKQALKRFLDSPGGALGIFESLYLVPLLFFAVVGAVRGMKTQSRAACMINLLIAGYFLLVPGLLLLGRMRAPAMPSIGLLSALGITSIFSVRSKA
ncbi:MAG TPA: glycosyltransferase family 39 protein [Nitrososphaera sp.]|nr:glycosyltransferase family 39 protein [Nitrososphaera sp.]